MSNNFIKKEYTLYYSVVLLSISLVLSYVEAILPINSGNMGVKIGLANIVTLLALHILDTKWTLLINIIRLLIMGIIFPNLVRFVLSCTGFLVSFIVMVFMIKVLNFSMITSSIFGAVSHNVAQVICVSILLKNGDILGLMPFYVFIGIIAGFFVGLVSEMLYKKIIILHLNK